uniref:Uncharacterized protein n=1 Tax=Anguilla anguilla TaxID=7936 RepID=A0A0E9PWH1_ANGAN
MTPLKSCNFMFSCLCSIIREQIGHGIYVHIYHRRG